MDVAKVFKNICDWLTEKQPVRVLKFEIELVASPIIGVRDASPKISCFPQSTAAGFRRGHHDIRSDDNTIPDTPKGTSLNMDSGHLSYTEG
jgi:hypothetical protein